ncbi:acyltransferase [Chitinophaga sp. S165]|uniref:acyltransferase family protein n=1 Tax=Chitinophaga sp. S165 TaxID=2135462 RepID=UPI000D71C285|nr:acyltransferase [Chitinophaga sp. S165]PWV50569.1 peptidoglycan/LPS O-acetylase OafA/YrhL [Chitinophaga sp. S165]
METKRKVESLSFLRGLAVLLVCFCHFGNPFAEGNALSGMFDAFHEYGKYGVQIFFVISGFVIPLSLDKAGYQIKYYGKFLLKRAMRLHPPYLIALALTLIILAASNAVKHIPFPETFTSIIQSLFYLHYPDSNPVFWTLKVEAQYYLFIGLYFVILQKYPRLTLAISIPLFMLISQTPVVNYLDLFQHLLYFIIGIAGYLIYMRQGKSWFEMGCIAAITVFCFIFYGAAPTIAAAFTILVILLYTGKVHKAFDFLGEISYSVYLIHFPIGVKLINLTSRYVKPEFAIILFSITLVTCLVLGVIFWKYIERTFSERSNKISYGQRKKAPVLATS